MWLNCVNSCHRVKPTHRERAVGNHTITSSSTSQLCAVICPQVQWIRRVSRKSLRWGRSSCCEHSEPPGKLVRTHMHARVCVCVKKHGSGVTEILWLHGDFGEAITRSLSISRTKPWFTALASECAFLPFANDKPLNGIIRHHPWLRTILEHRRPVPCYNTSIILTSKLWSGFSDLPQDSQVKYKWVLQNTLWHVLLKPSLKKKKASKSFQLCNWKCFQILLSPT